MSQFIDLTGMRFGNLVVEKYIGQDDYRHTLFKCKCDCGNYTVQRASSLMGGRVISCGCIPNKKHEHYPKRLRNIFAGMKRRCYDTREKDKAYFRRGIKICDEWLNDANNFFKWAIENGYADNLTIDRVDGDKDYSPDNCRWIPAELNSALGGVAYVKKYYPEYLST